VGGTAAGQPAAKGARRVQAGSVSMSFEDLEGEWLVLAKSRWGRTSPCPGTVAAAAGSTRDQGMTETAPGAAGEARSGAARPARCSRMPRIRRGWVMKETTRITPRQPP
jgi:hypothetical protein